MGSLKLFYSGMAYTLPEYCYVGAVTEGTKNVRRLQLLNYVLAVNCEIIVTLGLRRTSRKYGRLAAIFKRLTCTL